MRVFRKIAVIVLSFILLACSDNNTSANKISKDEALRLCDPQVRDAVFSAASDAEGLVAGEQAMKNCMAQYNFY